MMLQPYETEANAMTKHKIGTREEWHSARCELFEREKVVIHDSHD